MARILLVEDDEILSETLVELLEFEGYDISLAGSGNLALELSSRGEFELFILDVNIPDFNGFELLEMLRDAKNLTPAIFLTSMNDIKSLSRGFELGAEDYVKKPFDFDELIVRIKAILRKSFDSKDDFISYGDLQYKISTNELIDTYDEVIIVRPQEKKLLQVFFKHIDKTIPKDDLLYELGSEGEASEGALRVYLTKLRKLGLNIVSQKGVGYKLASID